MLGVDISEPLIGRARALAPQDTPVQFRVADAGSAELPEGAFDILFSRFGVMFFDDPTGAFAHLRRALRPGGRGCPRADQRARASAAVRAAFAGRSGERSVMIDGAAWIVTARNPAS